MTPTAPLAQAVADEASTNDILVVVLESCDDSNDRVWIQDASMASRLKLKLPKGAGQRFVYGDVVRCNDVVYRRGGCFYHDFQAATTSAFWIYRLAHVAGNRATENSQACRIPYCMVTDKGEVDALVDWWMQRNPNSNALPKLPCQYRSLAELQDNVGMESHVVVQRVRQVVVAASEPAATKRKRKRPAAVALPSTTTITFATLSDKDSTTTMTLRLGPGKERFQLDAYRKLLEQAQRDRSAVCLMHVVARRTATNDSIVELQSTGNTVLQLAGEATVATQGSTAFVVPTPPTQANARQRCRCALHDIVMDDDNVSLRSLLLSSNNKAVRLKDVLWSKSGSYYKPASLVLASTMDSVPTTVRADGATVQVLCSGLGRDDDEVLAQDVLRGLLLESIELDWTLERSDDDDDGLQVVCVTLSHLQL